MTENELIQSPPAKVLSIYQAVVDLLNEGADINQLKVSDITQRAGIGKGTAYEYFSSKEELILCSLFFELKKRTDEMQKIAKSNGSFHDKLCAALDNIASNFKKNRTFCLLVQISTGFYKVSDAMKEEFKKSKGHIKLQEMQCFTDLLIEAGKKEQIIFVENAMYIVAEANHLKTGLTNEQMKEQIYRNILQILGKER